VAEVKVRATVEFVRGSQPIEGRLIRANARETPFVGWLALLSLLERAACEPTAAPEAPERVR
jgi:hypothetical protein